MLHAVVVTAAMLCCRSSATILLTLPFSTVLDRQRFIVLIVYGQQGNDEKRCSFWLFNSAVQQREAIIKKQFN